jgi:hypothetical protein
LYKTTLKDKHCSQAICNKNESANTHQFALKADTKPTQSYWQLKIHPSRHDGAYGAVGGAEE